LSPASPRVFLLSPANAGGERAQLLLSDRGKSELAGRLREQGAPLGEVFTFLSSLYFRGKLAYAQAFAGAPAGVPPSLVITSGAGLVPPEVSVTLDQLRRIAAIPIDASEPRYREPLERHARLLAAACGPECLIVLLGSVASPKYIEPLLDIFGDRLVFPAEFVGRGDMSRGGMLLRAARSGVALSYTPVAGAVLHGPRPPRLRPWKP
jgi:hypothetical protein